MKMDLQVSLAWLLLLSSSLLSEPASGMWWNSQGGSTGGQNLIWNKLSKWIKDLLRRKVSGEPQIRLVSGGDQCAGRVEVYYEGKWGTVCDDHFSKNSGDVVCRQLGCGHVVSVFGWSYFGRGTEDIHLDDVQCEGTESYLWDCPHAGWNTHDCGHNEDVGVICSAAARSTLAPTASSENPQTSTSASMFSTDSTVVTTTTGTPTSTDKGKEKKETTNVMCGNFERYMRFV
ncbi:deleted in malignant brain tumors 1 protein-like [Columba livia]|uniref:deleted in malignant brain tumors 1 protein-like n=1 Tax=Columba livia TaxID=8932 RepID=UPI0031B9D9FC